jgi:hypothetical protein
MVVNHVRRAVLHKITNLRGAAPVLAYSAFTGRCKRHRMRLFCRLGTTSTARKRTAPEDAVRPVFCATSWNRAGNAMLRGAASVTGAVRACI